MTDKEIYALELDLLQTISSKKTTLWHKFLAVLELSAITDKH